MNTMPDSTITCIDLTQTSIMHCLAAETFGFKERWHVENHRAQLGYGNGTIVVTQTDSSKIVTY